MVVDFSHAADSQVTHTDCSSRARVTGSYRLSWVCRSTPKGQRIRPAIALGFLGYQTDVKQMSEAWQETSGGKEKRLGVCLPSAAASLLECEQGFGKDREPAGTARAFITEWLPRLKGQQACSAAAAGGDDSAEALEGAKAELRAQRVKQLLLLELQQQQQQQGSSDEKID